MDHGVSGSWGRDRCGEDHKQYHDYDPADYMIFCKIGTITAAPVAVLWAVMCTVAHMPLV